MSGNPKGFAVGVGCGWFCWGGYGEIGAIWKPERRFLAFCRWCLRWVGGVCACGRWWSVWKPYALCGARDALCLFGELVRLSGGGSCLGWIIAHSETLNVHFSGVMWVLIWIWGNLGCGRAHRNFKRSFCMGGNLGFALLRNFGVLFGRCGNLKGLFGRVKTSVCGAVGNLESAFRGIVKLRGGFLRAWKLGILAH